MWASSPGANLSEQASGGRWDMDGHRWYRGERAGAAVLSAAVLGAVLWPLRQHRRAVAERVDGFPLSHYPMFIADRRRCCGITYVVAVRSTGTRTFLRHDALGPGGLNQVRRQLYRVAVTEGRAAEYVAALAARIRAERGYADVVRVEVVRGRFDLDACLLDRAVRGRETVLAAADVPPAPA